jgi:hypothetical protein
MSAVNNWAARLSGLSRSDLVHWHVASVQTHGLNGRYRMHSGQRSEPALNGSVAFDPKRKPPPVQFYICGDR